MKLAKTEKGEVFLDHLGRRFYAEDLLPSGERAGDLPGLDVELRREWLAQKRQRSSGPQYKVDRKVTLGVRVSVETREGLAVEAEREGVKMSTLAARVLEEYLQTLTREAGADEPV